MLLAPFSAKQPSVAQPDLDYSAPEVQLDAKAGNVANASASSDIFSFGLLVCAVFTGGRSPVCVNGDTDNYAAAIGSLEKRLEAGILTQLPPGLADPVRRMLSRSPQHRPTTELLSLHKFFNDDCLLLLQTVAAFDGKTLKEKAEMLQRVADLADKLPKVSFCFAALTVHFLVNLAKVLCANNFSEIIQNFNSFPAFICFSQFFREEVTKSKESFTGLK